MGDVNRLVLVVERTKALLPYWSTILRDYIGKLVRAFCGNKAMNKTGPSIALALVEFNTRGSSSSSLVKRSNWTTNVDNFFKWLRGIDFTDADFPDVAIAEGLNEALTSFGLHNQMFPSPIGSQTQQNEGLQNHCILVVANKSDNCLSDAVMIAQSFPQLSVSLSVICPTQFIGIKSIYNAGKKNPSAADQTINFVKNSHYLVLISENFKEACDDLSQSGITTEVASISPVSPGKRKKPDNPDIPSISRSSQISRVNETPMNWQPVSVGSIPPEVNIDDHNTMDMSDILYGGTASSVPGAQTVKSFGQSSNTSMAGSATFSGIAQHAAHGSLTSATSKNPGSTSLGMQQPLDVQEYVGMDPFASVVNQENLLARQLLQTGTDMNLKMTSVVQSSMPATGTMMPPPGTSQPVGTSNALQSEEEEFQELWEGDLTAILNSQTVIITKLKGYQCLIDSATLAEDWPSTMLIDTFVPENFFEKYDGKEDLVVFEPTNPQHILLEKMQKTKDLAVVRLPSQVLALMAPVEKGNPMSGILLPKDAMAGDISQYLQDRDK